MNSIFSKSDFSLDEGERLLKEMQELKNDLTRYGNVVSCLGKQSKEIVPLKERRRAITRPVTVTSLCNYNQFKVLENYSLNR